MSHTLTGLFKILQIEITLIIILINEVKLSIL